MGLLFPDDQSDNGLRQKGFSRYKQLLSEHALQWMTINIITCLAAIPLVIAIGYSVMATSILLLFPLSFLAGMFFGPFYSCLYDCIYRDMRDEPGTWWEHYRKGLSQNWKDALLPGGIYGILIASFVFMSFLIYWQESQVHYSIIAMYFISAILVLSLITLYWSFLVLFEQSLKQRLVSLIAFSSRNFFRLISLSLFQMIIITITVMLAPWTLLLVPLLGWYVRFLILFRLYESLDAFFRLEERIREKGR